MSADLDAFRSGYLAAFRSYLAGGGETGLELAYELGREAVADDLSLLELAGRRRPDSSSATPRSCAAWPMRRWPSTRPCPSTRCSRCSASGPPR
jgi:hypothetical protein